MPNRLVDAVSPYLRSHADNPVDWRQWGPEPFAEAARRDVPLLISIGYSTCHWCHVMARESFSDPVLAAFLNENFVPIKVDREEYPDVDSSYMASASVFTENLGWPLNVFVTPGGKAFYAGTYWPPTALVGHPSFRQVLEALHDAWQDRREEVETNASAVASALAAQTRQPVSALPDRAGFEAAVADLAAYEDAEFGGFGTAPKFPMVPVLQFLLSLGGAAEALALADRTLVTMANSDLRDPVEGGFFRYSTQRDWADPHYERMLYDNAQLLSAYSELAVAVPERAEFAGNIVAALADFLIQRMQIDGGGFGSGQDSESTVGGERVEGGYYRLDADGRAAETPPALDEKVLTGWNGLAIDALALAGFRANRPDWIAAASGAADYLLARHLRADGTLLRASIAGRASEAPATLEDYGLFAGGLLRLATATGDIRYATAGRALIDACLTDDGEFAVPGGPDAVLAQHGLALDADPSDAAHPSGMSAMAEAARRLYQLTGHAPYQQAATQAMGRVASLAVRRPTSFGAALATMVALTAPVEQLVVVGNPTAPLATLARSFARASATVALVTDQQAAEFAAAGFELFEARATQAGRPTAYLCRDFVCHLPLTDPGALAAELAAV